MQEDMLKIMSLGKKKKEEKPSTLKILDYLQENMPEMSAEEETPETEEELKKKAVLKK